MSDAREHARHDAVAARAIEPKRVLRDVIELAMQRLLEQAARAVETRLAACNTRSKSLPIAAFSGSLPSQSGSVKTISSTATAIGAVRRVRLRASLMAIRASHDLKPSGPRNWSR